MDGTYAYHYDAWNRLVFVAKAFRESTPDGNGGVTLGSVQEGSTVHLSSYDGLNRRIEKQVQNSTDLDCTYHYYYDVNWRILETRNGSDMVLQQNTWAPLNSPGGGTGYVDELVEVAYNGSPTLQTTCEVELWACQDANYNVLGLLAYDSRVTERYEYTPYGQRTVFMCAGSNDPDGYAPTLVSQRIVTQDAPAGVTQPYGLCSFGHQGLPHEEELSNGAVIQNRWRTYHTDLGWLQGEPGGYVDSASRRGYCLNNPVSWVDPSGWEAEHVGLLQQRIQNGIENEMGETQEFTRGNQVIYNSPEQQAIVNAVYIGQIGADVVSDILGHLDIRVGSVFPILERGCCCDGKGVSTYTAAGTEILLGVKLKAQISNTYLELSLTSKPEDGKLPRCPTVGRYYQVHAGYKHSAKGEVLGIGGGSSLTAEGSASLTPDGPKVGGMLKSKFEASALNVSASVSGQIDTNKLAKVAAAIEHSAGPDLELSVGSIQMFNVTLKSGCNQNNDK